MIASMWASYGSVIEFSLIAAILAMSTFVVLWTGILSLAGGMFAAISAFVAIDVTARFDLPPLALLAIGGLTGAAASTVVGLVLLRLSSHWIALASIAALLVTRELVLNVPAATGGASGKVFLNTIGVDYLVGTLIVFMWLFARLRRSKLGLAMESVREDKDVAASLGVNVRTTRLKAFVFSGVLAGVGGVLYGNYVQFVSPETFSVNLAFTTLAAVVLGGSLHWMGAVVGGVFFYVLPEILRGPLGDGRDVVTGVVLILCMIFLPNGLVAPGRGDQLQSLGRMRQAIPWSFGGADK